MNTPITPIPTPPEPPKPVVPPEPISGKKVALYVAVGLVAVVGITLAAWEEGRVNLGAGLGMKGFKRRQADRAATNANGNKPNYTEAFRLYQLDAEKGDGEAMRKIGEMYRDGRGVPQSDAKARESWNKAAASGDVGTLLWLADKYRVGDGRALPVNHPESIRLLRRAASQGNAEAQAKLAKQLLAYINEYKMRLEFDEVLSARQRDELITSLPKVIAIFKAKADGSLEKMSRSKMEAMVAGASEEVRASLQEKFKWEAYFWLSLAAATNDEAELRGTRDGVASRLKDKQVERVQGLVAKWSGSAAPGNAESPFALDEGPVVEAPDAPKQTLSALLEEIQTKAAQKQPEPVAEVTALPTTTKTVPAVVPAPAQVKPLVSAARAMSDSSEAIDETKAYVAALYEAQVGMAVRRNILLSLPPQSTAYSRIAKNYYMAGAETFACYNRIKSLRASAKQVHPAVLAYSDALIRLLAGRLANIRKIHEKAQEVSDGRANDEDFASAMHAYALFDQDELPKVDSYEAAMTRKLGNDYSYAPPERSAAYTSTYAAHVQKVVKVLGESTDADIYSLLVGTKLDGWTFEQGEFRSAKRGAAAIEANGQIALPYTLLVRGNVTGGQRVMKLTLYFSVSGSGRLVLVGIFG